MKADLAFPSSTSTNKRWNARLGRGKAKYVFQRSVAFFYYVFCKDKHALLFLDLGFIGIWEYGNGNGNGLAVPASLMKPGVRGTPSPSNPPLRSPFTLAPLPGGVVRMRLFFLMTTYDDSLAYFLLFCLFLRDFCETAFKWGRVGGDSYFFCFERERDVMCWWLIE